MIRPFKKRLSVRSIVNICLTVGFRSRHPTRCHRLTLDHRRRRHAWGKAHNGWDRRRWRNCLHWRVSLHAVSQWWLCSCELRAKGKTDACIRPTNVNCGSSVMVGSAIHLPSATGAFGRNVMDFQDNAMPASHVTWLLCWHNRMWRSWTVQLGVKTGAPLSMFVTKWGSTSETWVTPAYCARIAACCPSGMGCGGEHTASCACPSRHQRGSNKVLVLWWHGR